MILVISPVQSVYLYAGKSYVILFLYLLYKLPLHITCYMILVICFSDVLYEVSADKSKWPLETFTVSISQAYNI